MRPIVFLFVWVFTACGYHDLSSDAPMAFQRLMPDVEPQDVSLLEVYGIAVDGSSSHELEANPSFTHGETNLVEMFYKSSGFRRMSKFSGLMVAPVLLGFVFLVFVFFSVCVYTQRKDQSLLAMPLGASSPGEPADNEEGHNPLDCDANMELPKWSILAIAGLTSYRFYTGFLSSTWMPYLLAMEGHQLVEERQSLFMGSAKLIYGLSILLNPLFGLLGDNAAAISHWSDRRLFLVSGVVASGIGIYGCVLAAGMHSIWWYLVATALWMLGEAMADVTTESLVPSLLPRSQYEVSSSIRALNFLLGGLTGYGMLILFRHVHYDWLYYGYLVVMFSCAGLSLAFIGRRDARRERSAANRRQVEDKSIVFFLLQAYIVPTRLEGGFPRACLCLFIFSLGSAPMFFLLLMVRDIVGVTDAVDLQKHFSIISIVFFICAALASILGALQSYLFPEGTTLPDTISDTGGSSMANRHSSSRWRLMVISTVSFGVICAAIPGCGIFSTFSLRLSTFYTLAAFYGLAFGAVYSRFQDCTWSLLPPGGDIANLMGFAAMSKLAGVGIGNFVAGIILDSYSSGAASYQFRGYLFMCGFCAIVVFISAALAWSVGKIALKHSMAPQSF